MRIHLLLFPLSGPLLATASPPQRHNTAADTGTFTLTQRREGEGP
jgi:hypothetical protein